MFKNVKEGVRDCTVSKTVTPNNKLGRTGKHRCHTVRACLCAQAGAESGARTASQVGL
jgi:hypothetical protein